MQTDNFPNFSNNTSCSNENVKLLKTIKQIYNKQKGQTVTFDQFHDLTIVIHSEVFGDMCAERLQWLKLLYLDLFQ